MRRREHGEEELQPQDLASIGKGAALAVALLVVVALVAAVVSNSSSGGGAVTTTPKPSGPGHSAFGAYQACKSLVRDRLKAPSSADFPWVRSSDVTEALGGGRYRVRSYVDAQNSFGGMIRNRYDCTVRYSSGSWVAEGVSVGGG